MLALVAALAGATQPASAQSQVDFDRTAWIFSTVGHSEFCPAGNVKIDLRSGLYALTPRAPRNVCDDIDLERPVKKGKLSGRNLTGLRAAYLRVLSEGFENPACREHRQPEEIIVSNGGTPVLVLTNGIGTESAPDDLGCWSTAASALHDALDRVFSPEDHR